MEGREHIHVAITDGGTMPNPDSVATFMFDNHQALSHVVERLDEAVDHAQQARDTADSYNDSMEAELWRHYLEGWFHAAQHELHIRRPVKEGDVLQFDGVELDKGADLLVFSCVEEDCYLEEPDDAPDEPPEWQRAEVEERRNSGHHYNPTY